MAPGDYNRHKLDAFTARVQDFITQRRLLQPGSHLVVAVSGGADSMALLDCLSALGYRLTVAHLDHAIRPGSWAEAEQVLRQAAARGIPAVAERCDVPAAAAPGENLESAARRLRYAFLACVAAETGAEAVATGHTADDQIETFLLHLLRGSGTQGLRGMLAQQPLQDVAAIPAAAGIRLIRPLLRLWRSETLGYCRAMGISVIEDPSNLDRGLLRNRVRHDLVPLLEQYNPQVRKAIFRAAQATAEAHAALSQEVEQAWPRIAVQRPDGVRLNLAPFRRLPEAVQKLSLRRALVACGGETDESGSIERLIRLCQAVSPGHAELGAGVAAWRTRSCLFIVRPADGVWAGFPQCPFRTPSVLRCEQRVRLSQGWSLTCARVAVRRGFLPALQQDASPQTAWLPAGLQGTMLTVRPWQAGDRMRVFGTGGTVKVADLLARAEVPPPARAAWPVVLRDGEIAWVPGVRCGELCRVASSARAVLQLALIGPRSKPVWLGCESAVGD